MNDGQSTVLVVDDDLKNHKIIQGILEDDYVLVSAFSGQECLDAVDSSQPHLVLLDIMMPDIDGYEVCKRLKSESATRDMPIIFISAKGSLEERLEGYEAGADDYFTKPFDHDELAFKIHRLLTTRQSLEAMEERAKEATDVAMKAMTNTSELGVIINFLQLSFTTRNHQELANALIEAMAAYNLSCSVQIRDGQETLNASATGWVSPLEAQVLTQSQSKGRIFDFKHYTVVNFDHVSMLIRNMPLDDAHQYGTIKDNVCILLEGAEARVNATVTEQEVDKQSHYLRQIIQHALAATERNNEAYHELRLKQATIVEQLMDRVEELIPRMGLQESHETELLGIVQACVDETNRLFNQGLRLDEQFTGLLKELNEVSSRHGFSSEGFSRLIKKLQH